MIRHHLRCAISACCLLAASVSGCGTLFKSSGPAEVRPAPPAPAPAPAPPPPPPVPVVPPPPVAPQPTPDDPGSKTGPLVPSRATLLPKELPAPESPLRAYVLFTSLPGAGSQVGRAKSVCAAYLRAFMPNRAYKTYDAPQVTLLPTYWLITRKTKEDDCKEMIRNYDQARASILVAEAKKTGVRGPVLAAWTSPKEGKEIQSVTVDLSRFSEKDMETAMDIWSRKLVNKPATWNNLDTELVRAEFNNFVGKYGAQIVSVISPKKE